MIHKCWLWTTQSFRHSDIHTVTSTEHAEMGVIQACPIMCVLNESDDLQKHFFSATIDIWMFISSFYPVCNAFARNTCTVGSIPSVSSRTEASGSGNVRPIDATENEKGKGWQDMQKPKHTQNFRKAFSVNGRTQAIEPFGISSRTYSPPGSLIINTQGARSTSNSSRLL